MTSDEAKTILLPYSFKTVGKETTEMIQALDLASSDAELSAWLDAHLERQKAVQKSFAGITIPVGLKEQIISEHRAAVLNRSLGTKTSMLMGAAAVLLVLAIAVLVFAPISRNTAGPRDFPAEMTRLALRGYSMDLTSTNQDEIKQFLNRNGAPANIALPTGLQNARLFGCSVETWNNAKVSMICLGSKSRASNQDAWLFVIDKKSLPFEAAGTLIGHNDHLATAQWASGDSVYLLEFIGTETSIHELL